MGKFGWSYPPGAANDPSAPYNQTETEPDNEIVKEAFEEQSGPWAVYRVAYKYCDCGPSIGFLITTWETDDSPDACADRQVSKWIYCDSLRALGTWKDMDDAGALITAISVGSIVEGVEQCTETIILDVAEYSDGAALSSAFDDALQKVNNEANEIWLSTHGCETCAKDAGLDWDQTCGDVPVNPKCPDCQGHGTVI